MMNQFCWYLSIKYISITGDFLDYPIDKIPPY